MRHLIIGSGLALLLAFGARAQQSPSFTPGKLVVLRGGDGIITIASGRQHPIFLDEYDPAITNQASPLLSVELPTNSGTSSLFMNAHAGSEGMGFTRSMDRQYLTVCGYCGNLNSIAGTPSSATNSQGQGYARGFGTIDAFTNFNVTYSSPEWYGLQPGITQNNPRGIATDGSNDFWGCGTIAGTQSGGFSETGTMFWNGGVSPDPEIVQSAVESAYFMRIINGSLYMVALSEVGGAQFNGIYNFVDLPFNGGAPVPLPWIPGGVQHIVLTNLFLNAGNTYGNLKSFDMNPAGTIAYLADTTFGIIKFVNSGAGSWTSPYLFSSNNIGSFNNSHTNFPKGATGCFGIAVDFSGTNPIIYATTMDEGDQKNTCSNRLISIIDTGVAPGANLVATTLAVAHNINEVFRGVEFAPDLTPLITSQPAGGYTLTNETEVLSVGVQSVYPVTYQWTYNGTNLTNGGDVTGSTNGALTITPTDITNSGSYTVVVSNQYGAVTSQVAVLTVTEQPLPPIIPNYAVQFVTNFIGNNQAFSVSPNGTPPFTYQWYFGTTPLVDDGVTYFGSTNATLYITNLQTSNSGSYYLTISNAAITGFSNLMAVLSVQYVLPAIGAGGEPISVTNLVGQTISYNVSASGTQPLSYQWYQLHGTNRVALNNVNEFSGVTTPSLTITGTTSADATNYVCIVTNAGGSATSSIVSDTVLTPPPYSYLAYSNQVYTQNFDSLPNSGSTAVNTIGGGGPVLIGNTTYEVADPFDFAFPLYNNVTLGASGGLALSNTMAGWYGECDGDTAQSGGQLGAADGSTTTGGIYSFGTLDSNNTNRALGLIATSTSGGTHFGLKLINTTANPLNYVSMQFTGEFWKTGTKPKIMQFTYAIDPAGTNSILSSSEILASSNNPVADLTFSFPTAGVIGGTNGNLPQNQTNMAVTNMPLASAWAPGSALWLVWSINDATGSGQGYGIDNFGFYGSVTNVLTQANVFNLSGVNYSAGSGLSFGFSTVPFSSAALSVRATTNLSLPLSQWANLGHPTEATFGAYQFLDSGATTNSQTFYTVTSP